MSKAAGRNRITALGIPTGRRPPDANKVMESARQNCIREEFPAANFAIWSALNLFKTQINK